jgi:spore coat polysaccharide biosynthesis protein SpsF
MERYEHNIRVQKKKIWPWRSDMRKVIGVITGRMASTRLPEKVMKPLAGKSVFAHHAERMKEVAGLDGIYLATSTDPKNSILIDEAERLGCGWYAGPEEDVVERHIRICEREEADAVIRVTCDCPLFNIDITSRFVETFKKEYFDFIYCGNMPMMYGTLTELLSYKALQRVHEVYRGPAICLPIRENLSEYKITTIDVEQDLVRPEYRLTVDEIPDLTLMEHVYNALYKGYPIKLKDVYSWLDDNPDIAYINRGVNVKGINLYAATLMEKPLYSIIRSQNHFIILDEKKQVVKPEKFIDRIKKLKKSGKLV